MVSEQFHPWPQLRLEWLWVYHGMVPVTETWSKDIVVPYSVFFVMEGEGRIYADRRKLTLGPGTAFFAAAGVRRQWFARGTRLLSVGFRALWPDGMPLIQQGLNCALTITETEDLLTSTRKLLRSIHGRKPLVAYADAVRTTAASLPEWSRHEAAFRSWFCNYTDTLHHHGLLTAQANRSTDDRVQELVRRLEAWPLGQSLNAAKWAHDLDIGIRRAEQLLASHLGITPHSFLSRRRLMLAQSLLTNTSTPLKAIAHKIGMRHASHFTKWFRRHAGVAPSAYRTRKMNDGA